MSLHLWIILYLLVASASVWIVWGRNAERFAGSGFLAFVLRDMWAGHESPGCLRASGWIALVCETLIFIYGIYNPEARQFWDLF